MFNFLEEKIICLWVLAEPLTVLGTDSSSFLLAFLFLFSLVIVLKSY